MTEIGSITLIKIFIPAALTFVVGVSIAPILTQYFHKHRMWKRISRKSAEKTDAFKKIHNEAGELSTPRVGGVIIWLSVAIVVLAFVLLAWIFPSPLTEKLNFLSRGQTFIPLFALVAAALVGLSDDLLQIFGKGGYAADDIVYRKIKAGTIIFIGLLIGWWFVAKLGVTAVHVPFYGELELGYLFVPFFIIIMLATFSTSVIDGIDGLAAGVLAPVFIGYAIIAFFNNQIDLAAFSSAVAGGILAFLWFNIPPAKFYMGETGMLGLTVTLSVLAFMTDTVFILPIIALPLVVTSLSVIIQMASRSFRNGKRVFLVAPLHHHFEALGWPSYKVTMRYWVLAMVSVVVGVILALLSK
ncbi:MAG: Phospho-N-acetylmuramoyl-pentapeptide-transferase [Parcubacteria group bacterium GW2011_GWA1_47_8]|nr:MAG: Phospho-N-acetylmuramoyl-pentapeptide-transferase [Parcubacteria group bacterium GW2011_GWA1_47_8]KKW07127.1 MAG: Phospho-N-acetylmuramoyl-pentapeptide-transferase [Parcubacteria group bacterium GW2011_GWA2_49_16]